MTPAVPTQAIANAKAFNRQGNFFKSKGKLAEAAECYRQAIALSPELAEAHHSLGVLHLLSSNAQQAIIHLAKAVASKPNIAEAHSDLGAAWQAAGNLREAIASGSRAVAIKPDFMIAHYNLGCNLRDAGQPSDAINALLRAIALAPDFVAAYNDLGVTYDSIGHLDDAIDCYRKALALQPDFSNAWNNLGLVFQRKNKPEQALACHRKALSFDKLSHTAHSNILLCLQYLSSYTPKEIFQEHLRFGAQFEPPLKAAWVTHRNSRDPNKRLKIGYVSPDFRRHAVAYFIEPVLANHDKASVEVFCYHTHHHADPVTLRLQKLADHWLPCKHLSDEQLAERIRADGIDILVELAGHTGGNRLLSFARKPAPVQVTYLGYPCTTGLSAIDYRLTDSYAEPPGLTDDLNVERLWRLPELFCCYRPHDNSPDVIDHPPALDNGFVTFGCFNNFSKVTDPVLHLWARILQTVNDARLMLEIPGLDDPLFLAEVEERLRRAGLPMERLTLVPRSPQNQYVLYNQIDVALDPFPCNGGTTSLDTLWMGVPFIALAGRHFSSRMGVSILSNAGLAELIADSEKEYVELAVKLATDQTRLTTLRAGLRQRVQASPLMDAPRFTRHLEQAYREMWGNWCASSHDVLSPLQQEIASLNTQGNSLLGQGLFDQATRCFQQALQLAPDDPDTLHSLGISLQYQSRYSEALACYEKVLARNPDIAGIHNNIGVLFADQGQTKEAITAYRKAIAIAPQYAEAYNNLANALKKLDRFEEAENNYRQAIVIKPDMAETHANLGALLKIEGKLDEALKCYKQALACDPHHALAYHNLLLTMQYASNYTPKDIFAAHVAYGERFAAPLRPHWPAHANEAKADKRLKIGYVSPDFWNHVIPNFMEPILAQHDKSQIEIYCYYSHTRVDPVTQRLQAYADHWIPCKHLSDGQLAKRIAGDGIDILVDLSGHTDGTRLPAFVLKPAPIQVSYLGYVCTTGLSAIDYRVTDAIADPPGMTEHLHVEQLWRLPDALFCYRPYADHADMIDHPPCRDEGFITFGCLNNFSKVTDETLSLWAKILKRVGDSKLMLSIFGIEEALFRRDVEDRLSRNGIPVERCILLPRRSYAQYLQDYNRIDLALDPFPFNGGTTSLDTLWMGVPFVTLSGKHFVSRMGTSILTHAGLPELIAKSKKAYVDIAIELARDIPRLTAIRANLRERLVASPLMDAQRFTHHLEAAYREMWQRWCATKSG